MRLLELLGLFVLLPAVFYWWTPVFILPILWAFALGCTLMLAVDPAFDRKRFWNLKALRGSGKSLLLQAVLATAVLSAVVCIFMPQAFFGLAARRPVLWLLIIFLYPLLSVYPQELIYRTFFFHRYKRLFAGKSLAIIANAVLFGYMHIIFHNWIAVGLTSAGGIVFAVTYTRSRSTLLVAVQHALYGGVVFSVGLGQFFYTGAVSTIPRHLKF